MTRTGISQRILLALAIALVPHTAMAGFPAAPGNDTGPSLGQFFIWVDPAFRAPLIGNACYDSAAGIFTSPVLRDSNTIVARSGPAHSNGSGSDTAGVSVGSPAVTTVADSDFVVIPTAGFQAGGSPNPLEIHTLIKRMQLIDEFNNIKVRAGPDAGIPVGVRKSAGEVEGITAGDFPNGESFFNIFAEIDINAMGITLFNDTPLVVVNSNIAALPPKVVYIHGETNAVPVKVKATGNLFGYLTLAGHGMNYNCADPNTPPPNCVGAPQGGPVCPDGQTFYNQMQQILATQGMMNCPQCLVSNIPTLGPVGFAMLMTLLAGTGVFILIRRL